MTRLAKRIRQFLALTPIDRKLFLEAVLWLAISRLAILFLPFRWIAPRLGKLNAGGSGSTRPSVDVTVVRMVSRTVQTAARHMPWQCKCLVQAMTAKAFFKRRKIPSVLYLGVAKEKDNELSAHAWVRSGGWIITGGGNLNRYAVVAEFS